MTQQQETISDAGQMRQALARRDLDEITWRALKESVYPGAASESVLMVADYCKARKLDPLKKPVHIVPMKVKDARTGNESWRDVVMPGIAELRITAFRTGEYMGHSRPTYGDDIEVQGVKAPEWCEITVLRMVDGRVAEFPYREYFREAYKTKGKDGEINAMWSRRPIGQLTKCALAGALRDAFPEEIGGTTTAEEMEGSVIEGEFDHNPREQEASTDDLNEAIRGQATREPEAQAEAVEANAAPETEAQDAAPRAEPEQPTEQPAETKPAPKVDDLIAEIMGADSLEQLEAAMTAALEHVRAGDKTKARAAYQKRLKVLQAREDGAGNS